MSLWDEGNVELIKTKWYEWLYLIPVYIIAGLLWALLSPLAIFMLWLRCED